MKNTYISIVAPAYNEAKGIKEVIEEWTIFLNKNEPNYEIIICNDGSIDNTWKELEKIAKRKKKVKNVGYKKNQGASVALATAIENSTGKWVLMMDSDGQFPISEYKKLKATQRKSKYMAIIGARKLKQDNVLNRLGSELSGMVSNMLLKSNLRDFNSAFKLVEGDLARSLLIDARGLNYSTDVTAKLLEQGVKIAEVEIIHRKRAKGKSSLKFIKAAKDRYLFVKYLITRRKLIQQKILRNKQTMKDSTQKGINWK